MIMQLLTETYHIREPLPHMRERQAALVSIQSSPLQLYTITLQLQLRALIL